MTFDEYMKPYEKPDKPLVFNPMWGGNGNEAIYWGRYIHKYRKGMVQYYWREIFARHRALSRMLDDHGDCSWRIIYGECDCVDVVMKLHSDTEKAF